MLPWLLGLFNSIFLSFILPLFGGCHLHWAVTALHFLKCLHSLHSFADF